MGGQSLQSQIQSPHSRRGEQGAKIEALSSNLKGTQRQQTLKRLSSVVTVLPDIPTLVPPWSWQHSVGSTCYLRGRTCVYINHLFAVSYEAVWTNTSDELVWRRSSGGGGMNKC